MFPFLFGKLEVLVVHLVPCSATISGILDSQTASQNSSQSESHRFHRAALARTALAVLDGKNVSFKISTYENVWNIYPTTPEN